MIIRRSLFVSLLVLGSLSALVACGSDPTPTVVSVSTPAVAPTQMPTSAPTSTPTPAPTATPTPAPTPTPTSAPTMDDLLASVGEKLAAMSTARFRMIDETESGAPFFGTTFKSLEGEVKSPDSFRMLVKVVAPGLGFVEIEMMAVGDQALLKFSEDAPWTPLPLEQVPFNFGGIGVSLSGILADLKNITIIEGEMLGDTRTIRIDGNTSSDGMSELITSADPGHSIALTFWVDEVEHTLRQFRITGKLFNDDAPETQRLLDISGVNVPVDIQLPELESGQ